MNGKNLAGYRSRLMLDLARLETVANSLDGIVIELHRERTQRADDAAQRIIQARTLIRHSTQLGAIVLVQAALDGLPLDAAETE